MCENIWMQRLALKMDLKLVFPSRKTLFERIFPSIVTHCVNLYVQLQLDATPTIMATFDLWMSKDQQDTFAFVVNFLSTD